MTGATPPGARSAFVLCGGRSTRMGRDKASLPFGAETLLARVVRRLRDAVDEVVLVAREGQVVPAGFAVVRDPAEGLGPLAAIAVGLRAVRGDAAFVAACDLPFLRPALVRRLLDLGAGHDACVPLVEGFPMTTCAVYATSVAEVADQLVASGRLRLRDLLAAVDTRYIDPADLTDVDPLLDSFRDCNTPGAYAAALREAGL